MSFRARLTLFFVAIVIVPIATLAVLVIELSEDSRDGKADARLGAGLSTAGGLYQDALDRPTEVVERLTERPFFTSALLASNAAKLMIMAEAAAASGDVAGIEILDAGGESLASVGNLSALAAIETEIEQRGATIGIVRVGALDPGTFTRDLERLTGLGAAIVVDGQALSSTFDAGFDPEAIGDRGDIELAGGTTGRLASLDLDGGSDAGARLFLLTREEEGLVASSPLVLAALAIFLALAVALIAFLLRSLQGQIAGMLAAAQSIGAGDFTASIPVHGNDEMAGLAEEFNLMSDRLSEQMGQLRRQREQLDQSVRRIGAAFASGLDRSSLLEIVLETALSACDAEAGRVDLSGHEEAPVAAGIEMSRPIEAAITAAAAAALRNRAVAAAEQEGTHAIAHPLFEAGADDGEPLGTMAIAREGDPFGPSEREVLRYLIGQAAVSVENISLHERVSEQALTDELTGLANRRHFGDWMERETARLTRFGGELSLLILDLDDFKAINDSHGHPQGDRVLAAVGRILAHESRGIDEPARFGGEEFAIALPETPTEGAAEVAERVRARIAATEIPLGTGKESLTVSVSIGVATMPTHAGNANALISAADMALYRAKRAGKNRVEVAVPPTPETPVAAPAKQRWWRG